MTSFDVPRLERLIARIDKWLEHDDEDNGRLIVNALQGQEGASYRFSSGAYHLRLAGVATSCTSGCHGLLRNWKEAARRKIEQAKGAAR